MPVGQRNFDQTLLTLDFSFPNWGDATSYLQLTKIQKIRSTVVWWVSWTQSHSSLKGIKLIIWQNPSKIHLHISFEWVTGLLRIYPNTLAHRWNDRRGKVPLWKQLHNTLPRVSVCARYCLSTFYRWVPFVMLLGGKQVRPGALLRDEEAEGHHEMKQFGPAFL